MVPPNQRRGQQPYWVLDVLPKTISDIYRVHHCLLCSGYVSISRALAPLFIYLFIYFVLVSFVVSLFYKVFWFNEENTKGGGGETGGVEGKPSKGVGAEGATGGIKGRPRWTKAGRRWQTG